LKPNYTILSAVTHFVEKFLPAFSTEGFTGVFRGGAGHLAKFLQSSIFAP
jgi:hypothetical protein